MLDIDALERLGRLRNSGIISNAEFDQAKAKMLADVSSDQPGPGIRDARARFNVAHAITDKLGLEKVENFSVSTFFGDVFKRKDPDEIEQHLCVGYRNTTPPLTETMAHMPSPWLFGRMLLVSLAVFLPVYFAFSSSVNPLLLPGLVLIGAFAVPLSVLVLFFELNTPRNVSMTRVSYLFIMGAAASLLLSTVIYGMTPLLGIFGPPAAGLIEEVAKLAALVIVTRSIDVQRHPYALNGLLFGAAVGAGFAAFETAGYALVYGLAGGEATMMEVIVRRGLLSPFAHVAWTAMVGFAYWRLRVQNPVVSEVLKNPAFLRILGASVILHAAWDTDFELPLGAKYVVLGMVVWTIIISMTQSGLKEIGTKVAEVDLAASPVDAVVNA